LNAVARWRKLDDHEGFVLPTAKGNHALRTTTSKIGKNQVFLGLFLFVMEWCSHSQFYFTIRQQDRCEFKFPPDAEFEFYSCRVLPSVANAQVS
jgi:hypothetical protein